MIVVQSFVHCPPIRRLLLLLYLLLLLQLQLLLMPLLQLLLMSLLLHLVLMPLLLLLAQSRCARGEVVVAVPAGHRVGRLDATRWRQRVGTVRGKRRSRIGSGAYVNLMHRHVRLIEFHESHFAVRGCTCSSFFLL